MTLAEVKGKSDFLHSAVSSPRDCSKALHFACLFQYELLEAFNHAAVTARRLFVHMSTTYS